MTTGVSRAQAHETIIPIVNFANADNATTNGSGGIFVKRKIVTTTNDAQSQDCGFDLPARAIVLWATLKNKTALTAPDGGGTFVTGPYGVALVGVSAYTSLNTTATSQVLCVHTETAANGASRRPIFSLTGSSVNSTTSDVNLFLVPYDTDGANFFYTATTTPFVFSGTADIYVELVYMQFPDHANAS